MQVYYAYVRMQHTMHQIIQTNIRSHTYLHITKIGHNQRYGSIICKQGTG